MANPSFDVVSEVDHQEVINALDQARREVSQRFDFKNTGTTVEQNDSVIEVRANSEGRVEAAVDVIKDKMVKRKVSLKALSIGRIEPAGGANYKQQIEIVHGISDDKARAINKFIKGLGLKVQSQIQGEQLRVSSKSKDHLQQVIEALKEEDFGIPLQFTNYR